MNRSTRSLVAAAAGVGLCVSWSVAAITAAMLPPATLAAGIAMQPPAAAGKAKQKHDEKAKENKENKGAPEDAKDGKHPILRKAGRDLLDAKAYLEKAPHDFGGHRVAAIKAIDEALSQIKLAAEFDDAHTGPNEHGKGKGAGGPEKKDKGEKDKGKGDKPAGAPAPAGG